ncbi:cytochrome c oxidase assembly protein [Actinoplanes philippinensis]|uniref:Cytochrome d ubiquinol oxidase subunit II n=1 Tax=Actinoplanes philippinensis TaxID=35752 RepID=A0A1I2GT37_9ACTN|nr:cytochrome d ubiquinol oxidase subunit II [Actinoplanes philippinensis]GIE78047.1 cytochrome c oxidase assembly protein [Actinoplanes philippinensis]SFF20270.1 cytochrome d ubiquinol oxidase subunit II [Actinoplanes philippinensis]
MITFWFAVLVLAWVLYFVLEGFDFGVGMLTFLGRDEHERGAALRTIGPFWDGNEVWLVAAVGVTFAAFPDWYAALMSALYLPMVAILLLLAVRGVALEFRGKHDSPAWRRRADLLLTVSSGGVVLLWGAVLGILVDGLALRADGEVTGAGLGRSLGPLLSPAAGLGALAALLAAVLLGATFLALRTTGPVRRRARDVARHTGTAGAVTLLLIGIGTGSRLTLAAAAVVFAAGLLARRTREGLSFFAVAFTAGAAVVAVFTAHGDVVLRSTLDPAWSLTRESAAAGPEALRLLTVAGVLILPGVLVYQAWSYWVFRRRVASERVAS